MSKNNQGVGRQEVLFGKIRITESELFPRPGQLKMELIFFIDSPGVMGKTKALIIIPEERIMSKILLIRGKKVILAPDIAELHGGVCQAFK